VGVISPQSVIQERAVTHEEPASGTGIGDQGRGQLQDGHGRTAAKEATRGHVAADLDDPALYIEEAEIEAKTHAQGVDALAARDQQPRPGTLAREQRQTEEAAETGRRNGDLEAEEPPVLTVAEPDRFWIHTPVSVGAAVFRPCRPRSRIASPLVEYAAQPPVAVARSDSSFLQRVFLWMFVGLGITGGVAALIGSSDTLLTDITETPGLVIGVIVVQLGIVFGLSFAINRISVGLATVLFLIYSATVGVTFAFIFELYTTQSVFTAFLITAGMFGALAVWGALTDTDLSRVGAIAFMALIGLILATIVNIFWANDTLYWITTYAGVIIFAALTAYDMQKLTQINKQGLTGEAEGRAAIMGALTLYLDFINLFLFLLRIFGRER
jgi:uncharacterized protein